MKKTVKVGWVFYVSIHRYYTRNYFRKGRGANYFELIALGFRLSFGVPWAKPYINYHVMNSYGIQVEGIEKNNKEMASSPGFKLIMPKKKYIL